MNALLLLFVTMAISVFITLFYQLYVFFEDKPILKFLFIIIYFVLLQYCVRMTIEPYFN